MRSLYAWLVHLFTSLGAVCGLFSLHRISIGDIKGALIFWAIAVIIDAIDGAFARRAQVKIYSPNFDGTLLDNIVDFLNYTIAPCFLILQVPYMSWVLTIISVTAIIVASCYQFCHQHAKTPDNYFLGFPSYWNILVVYLYIFNIKDLSAFIFIIACSILSFIPIKFLYPSRLEYTFPNKNIRAVFVLFTTLWGSSVICAITEYPKVPNSVTITILSYTVIYLLLSLNRTLLKQHN